MIKSNEEGIHLLVKWLDNANDRHSDHEVSMRLLKVTEEAGEVAQAYIGYVGQNPRKGITHRADDVASELCDVIVTAMVALRSFSDSPEIKLNEHINGLINRIT